MLTVINNTLICQQRPTAKELLKHRFIKTAKKNTYLVELIERFKNWKQKCRDDDDSSSGEENEEYVYTLSNIVFFFIFTLQFSYVNISFKQMLK